MERRPVAPRTTAAHATCPAPLRMTYCGCDVFDRPAPKPLASHTYYLKQGRSGWREVPPRRSFPSAVQQQVVLLAAIRELCLTPHRLTRTCHTQASCCSNLVVLFTSAGLPAATDDDNGPRPRLHLHGRAPGCSPALCELMHVDCSTTPSGGLVLGANPATPFTRSVVHPRISEPPSLCAAWRSYTSLNTSLSPFSGPHPALSSSQRALSIRVVRCGHGGALARAPGRLSKNL